MGWRDKYQQASFRGVPFFVERAESEFGRRTQLHVFPYRDLPYSEDLGRSPRIFSVDGYLLGDDFYEQKELMLRAVEAPGLGKLVHPYYGSLLVGCRRCRVSDSNRELRMARLSFEFEESGEADEPVLPTNTKIPTDRIKKSTLTNLTNSFLAVYSIARRPLSEINKAMATLDQGVALIGTARRSVSSVADFQRRVLSIGERISALINDASQLVEEVVAVLTFGTFPFDKDNPLLASQAKDQLDELLGFFDLAPLSPSDVGSPVQRINEIFQLGSVVAYLGMIPEVEFESFDEASLALSRGLEALDNLEESDVLGGDKDLLGSIRSLRATVQQDLTYRADHLARLKEVTLPEFLPAIVLSSRLYGSVGEEDDLLNRNKISHPGFVPGLVPLQMRLLKNV